MGGCVAYVCARAASAHLEDVGHDKGNLHETEEDLELGLQARGYDQPNYAQQYTVQRRQSCLLLGRPLIEPAQAAEDHSGGDTYAQ